MSYNRFIALGDSMTEGMQDEKIRAIIAAGQIASLMLWLATMRTSPMPI